MRGHRTRSMALPTLWRMPDPSLRSSGNEYNSKFETRESRAAHIHDVLSIEVFLSKRRASHQQYTQHAGEQDGPVSRVHLALTTRQMGG